MEAEEVAFGGVDRAYAIEILRLRDALRRCHAASLVGGGDRPDFGEFFQKSELTLRDSELRELRVSFLVCRQASQPYRQSAQNAADLVLGEQRLLFEGIELRRDEFIETLIKFVLYYY